MTALSWSNRVGDCPNDGPEVFSNGVIISDDFSREPKWEKTKRFPVEAVGGA